MSRHPVETPCPKCGAPAGQVCVGKRGHERKAFHRERGSRRNHIGLNVSRFANHESPIEELLGAALTEWLDHSEITGITVETQKPFGPYRADIMVTDGLHRLVIEADGMMFHGGSDQMQHDRRRDRFCASEGIAVMRFTGREIMSDPRGCAAQVGVWIRRRK
jgi:very-short-patch-repair endonuclease